MTLDDCPPDDSPLNDVPAVNVPTDQWVKNAVASVDVAVTQLVADFMRNPFTHRVEGSFHIELYNLLLKQKPLRGRVRIGGAAYGTQLMHKEWPSDVPIALNGAKHATRQRYDLGILSPESVGGADLAHFTSGHISAAIAIEVGLDYSLPHLKGDFAKFKLNKKMCHPYVIHFSRKRTKQTLEIEALIRSAPAYVKTAFVHLDVNEQCFRVKRLDGTEFEDVPYEYNENCP